MGVFRQLNILLMLLPRKRENERKIAELVKTTEKYEILLKIRWEKILWKKYVL